MARRAARRALQPDVAQSLEDLGFTRQWPVFITRRAMCHPGTRGSHPISDGLGITMPVPVSEDEIGYLPALSALCATGVIDMKQWPCAKTAYELDAVRVVREPGFLLEPWARIHAYVLEGCMVAERCAIRVLVSDVSIAASDRLFVPFDERAPIYTQVECGEPESDTAQFWSYSLKGV